jgi:putative thioredoxin
MAESAFIIDVTRENYEQVMQASFKVPVLMDFWADWCQPCQALMPILARLAEEYQGKFLLAKLNTEEQQEIAARFAIRSIPTVKLFQNGEPVDEFMGALPDQAVRQFLDKHIVDEEKLAEEKARQLQFFEERVADAPGTADLEARVAEEPNDLESLYALALRKVIDGDHETAMELLLQLLQRNRDFGDDAGRLALLKIFELLGDDPRVGQYRRRMSNMLH